MAMTMLLSRSERGGREDEEVLRMRDSLRTRRHESDGFALILAILALMLLTTLGLTLAATTSTEIQIATNYKWSQQALYNAEAGLETGKRMLQRTDMVWSTILPAARPGFWTTAAPASAPSAPYTGATRNFENGSCDVRGGGQGYGAVLNNGALVLEDVTDVPAPISRSVRGAFTLWIRRVTVTNNDGTFSDSAKDDELVLTSEGSAPYTDVAAADAQFVAANRAIRVMEMTMTQTPGRECGTRAGQEGGGSGGAGFGACSQADNTTLPPALTGIAGAGNGSQIDAAVQ
jgi:hypothetical protein